MKLVDSRQVGRLPGLESTATEQLRLQPTREKSVTMKLIRCVLATAVQLYSRSYAAC